MSITKAEDIQKRLTSFDKDWHDTKYAEMCYSFGEPDMASYGTNSSGTFPWYKPITNKVKEVGRSMRIMNTSLIALARTFYNDPEPDFPKLSKIEGEMRKQFFRERYKGCYGTDGEWREQLVQTFVEGYNLGVGYVQHGVKTNPLTGQQYTTIQHVPTINVITDRHEISPARYRWIAFVKHLAPEDAIAIFGLKAVDKYIKGYNEGTSEGHEVVRLIEYYDLGYGKTDPTMSYILDDIENKPIEVTSSPFDHLPFSYYMHAIAPGVEHPIGAVWLQRATQEAINGIERTIGDHIKDFRPLEILKKEAFEAKSLRKYIAGESDILEIGDSNVEEPIIRMAAPEVPQTILQYLQMLNQQWNADSGVNDLERGNFSASARTLGENQLLDQRSQIQGGIAKTGAIKLCVRVAENMLRIAEKYDRDPIWIDVLGTKMLINDPQDPSTWIDNYTKTYSDVYIAERSMEYSDVLKQTQERLMELSSVAPFLANDPVGMMKLKEEALKAIGEDPKEWRGNNQDMGMGAMMQGGGVPNPDAGEKMRNGMLANGLQMPNAGV